MGRLCEDCQIPSKIMEEIESKQGDTLIIDEAPRFSGQDDNNDKMVEIGHLAREKDYNVSITNNGIQWRVVFSGTHHECEIIRDAFVKVGYKYSVGALFG